jgi:hypothetical protein
MNDRQLSDGALVLARPHGFDYQQLACSLRKPVQDQTEAIRSLVAKTAKNVVQIGLRLQYVHDRVGRERFQEWLAGEFGWSQASASKFMCIARVFGDADHIEHFDPSALYLLARRKVAKAARAEALQAARNGEPITRSRALAIIERHHAHAIVERRTAMGKRVRKYLEKAINNLPEEEAEEIRNELRELLSQWETTSR